MIDICVYGYGNTKIWPMNLYISKSMAVSPDTDPTTYSDSHMDV